MKIEDINIKRVEALIKVQIFACMEMIKFAESCSDHPESSAYKANIINTTVDSIVKQLNVIFDYEEPYDGTELRDCLANAIRDDSIVPAMNAIRTMYIARLLQENHRMKAIQDKIDTLRSGD